MTPYDTMTDGIVSYLDNGLDTAEVVAEPSEFGLSDRDEVGVRLDSESAVEDVMGSPEPYLTTLRYHLTCVSFSPDGMREAVRKRNELVMAVRNLLSADRTMGGILLVSQLVGIDFDSAPVDTGYFAAAIIEMNVIMRA